MPFPRDKRSGARWHPFGMIFNGINDSFNIEEERMGRFWICFVEGTDGGKHCKHGSLGIAQGEAERLARLRPRRYVYILECVGRCRVEQQPVKWEVPR